MAQFPDLPVQSGAHAAEWFVNGRTIPGEFSGDPLKPPTMRLFDDIQAVEWSEGVQLPRDYHYDRVVGRIRAGQDVVLADATISVWFPQRSMGSGRYAVVGLGTADGRAGLGLCPLADPALLPVSVARWTGL